MVFGDEDGPSNYALSNIDVEKLKRAPVHNMAAERRVGFINYGLQRRGANQLACASSTQVKAKGKYLIQMCPSGAYKTVVKKSRNPSDQQQMGNEAAKAD